MKKLTLIFTILFCSISFGQIWKFDEWGGNLYTSTNAEIYGLNNVPLKHLLGGKYTFSRAGADLEALFDKIDSLTLAMSSLNILDDGLTTQILVGGGLNVVPVWGTNLPTAITIGSAYIYRVGGTDVADGDVADTITITNISQVQDITATATEINYTTDVTSNIQAQIDGKQDTVLGITNAEIAYLDGLTDTVQQQLDLKAPLTAPTFATSITGSYLTASEILGTDASKNIISLAVATYPSLTELTYVKGVTSAIQTQMNLKAPLASPTFTDIIVTDSSVFNGRLIAPDGTSTLPAYSWANYRQSGWYMDGSTMKLMHGGRIKMQVPNSNARNYFPDDIAVLNVVTWGNSQDAIIRYEGLANILAMRNGEASQIFRIYDRFTTLTTNSRWTDIGWNADSTFHINARGSGQWANGRTTIYLDSSVVVGNPTGGNKGIGTLNATAVYDDGVLLTGADYIFDEKYNPHSIKEMKSFYEKNKYLPEIGTWKDDPDKRPSIGDLAFRLLKTVERQAIYIAELEERITALENK